MTVIMAIGSSFISFIMGASITSYFYGRQLDLINKFYERSNSFHQETIDMVLDTCFKLERKNKELKKKLSIIEK